MIEEGYIVPNTIAELQAYIDALTPVRERAARLRLGSAQIAATNRGDSEYLNASRIECNSLMLFGWEAEHLDEAALRRFFAPSDIPYLNQRADQTSNPAARARYLHAIYVISRRIDDAERALQAYEIAIRDFLSRERDAEGFWGLLGVLSAANALARGVKSLTFNDLLVEVINTGSGHVSLAALELAVRGRKAFGREHLRQVRDRSLALIGELASQDDGVIRRSVNIGTRLADRLQEPTISWRMAHAAALRRKLGLASEPLGRELTAREAAAVFQRLGDEEAVREMRQIMVEARRAQTTSIFSFELEDSVVQNLQTIREQAANVLNETDGAHLLSLWSNLLPPVAQLRSIIEAQAEAGIGVFVQMAASFWRATDGRITHEARPLDGFDSQFLRQYELAWTHAMGVTARAMLGEGIDSGELTADDLERILQAGWMAEELPVPLSATEELEPDLIWLLKPAVRLIFGVLDGTQDRAILVPAMDSLTIRFEEILRALARRLGLNHEFEGERRGRQSTMLRGIDLLGETAVRDLLGEDLSEFAIYTLDSPTEGFRDKVAHAATHRADYTETRARALLALLIRFARLVPSAISSDPRS